MFFVHTSNIFWISCLHRKKGKYWICFLFFKNHRDFSFFKGRFWWFWIFSKTFLFLPVFQLYWHHFFLNLSSDICCFVVAHLLSSVSTVVISLSWNVRTAKLVSCPLSHTPSRLFSTVTASLLHLIGISTDFVSAHQTPSGSSPPTSAPPTSLYSLQAVLSTFAPTVLLW